MTDLVNPFTFDYGVFDLDGTLIDTMPVYGDAFAGVCGRLLGAHVYNAAKAFYYRTTGMPMHEQFKMFVEQESPHKPSIDLCETLEQECVTKVDGVPTVEFSRARETIWALKRHGLTLFVTSASATHTVFRRLRDLGLTNDFTQVKGSSTEPKGMNHIVSFARTAGVRISTFASRAFMVGDGLVDMRIATKAGLAPIGVRGTNSDEELLAAGAKRLVNGVGDFLADPR